MTLLLILFALNLTHACLWGAFLVGAKVSDRTAFVRDWAYQQGLEDMYATKALMYEDWRRAVCRPSIVAGVVEAEGRHRVLDSPTAEFERIMHVEFIQDGAA